MLSRSNSNANSSLRRANSTPSVRDHPKHFSTTESIDPHIARLHALVAAHRAMERSRGSTSETIARQDSQRSTITFLQRSSKLLASPGLQSQGLSCRQDVSHNTENRGRAAGGADSLSPSSYLHSIVTGELDAPYETFGAESSSYRRLRKFESMSNPRYRNGETLSTTRRGFSSQNPTLRKAASSMSFRTTGLGPRLKRSFHLLRTGSRRSVQMTILQPESTCRPESIALARSQFLQQASLVQADDSPKTYRSAPSSGFRLVQETLRSPSRHLDAQVDSSDRAPGSPAPRKYSLSASLRKKFKRTIGRLKATHVNIPPQQVHATRSHLPVDPADCEAETGFDSYRVDDLQPIRRQSFYIPSEAAVSMQGTEYRSEDNIKTASSLHSVTSTSQSRLTSWSNSAASLSVREDPFEQKRLSVIKEDGGPHQPSCSAGRHISGVAIFQQPLQMEGGPQVDNQRLYSALMRRIDQEEAKPESEPGSVEQVLAKRPKGFTPQRLRPTIRTVQSLPSVNLTEEGISEADNRSTVHILNSMGSTEVNSKQSQRRHERQKYAQDHPSTFFSASTEERPYLRSPFRKLLDQQHEYTASQQSRPPSADSVRIHHTQAVAKQCDFTQSSESIYSRTTCGGTNLQYALPPGSSESFLPRVNLQDVQTGTATILSSCNASNENTPRTAPRVFTALSASASEKGAWKGWIEHQINDFGMRRLRSRGHTREKTQIDPDDVEIGRLQTPEPDNKRLADMVLRSKQTQQPSGPDNEASHKGPVTGPNMSVSRKPVPILPVSHETATSAIKVSGRESEIDAESLDTRTNPMPSSMDKLKAIRKISSRFLNSRKSQPVLSSNNVAGKENKLTTNNLAIDMQSQEDWKTESQSSSIDNGLRETSSNLPNARSRDKLLIPTQETEPTRESPCDKYKNLLSARLSRPFDMDVPECNRPFDSTYLGQNENLAASAADKNDRLSVATGVRHPRPTKSYGGLGIPKLHCVPERLRCDEDVGDTALPQLPDSETTPRMTSNTLSTAASSSRRMVSNFLRSRRKDQKQPSLDMTDAGSSPAFI